ncbi:hypothetical protein ACHWWK_15075 [Klebsiella pneumoniae]
MSRTRKTLVIITGTILLLIVLFFIVLATFDWNRLEADDQSESVRRT